MSTLEEVRIDGLVVRWLGRMAYADGLALQERLVESRRSGSTPDALLLLEHPAVITLGRAADRGNVLLSPQELGRRGIELFETGRGGDVTYHGPGQLVGYPILALSGEQRDAHRYLRDLEQALILTARDYGVEARREPGLTGIWVGREKLAAIGVRLSTGWITSHGFALNVTTDPEAFASIVPCGINGRGVTSLARLTGGRPGLREAASRVAGHLAAVLGRRILAAPREQERLAAPRRGSR